MDDERSKNLAEEQLQVDMEEARVKYERWLQIRKHSRPQPVAEYREPWLDRPDYDMDTAGRPLQPGT